MAMDVFVAFSRVDRIKKVWQAHNKTNNFYFCFDNAESATLAQSKTNNMEVLGCKLLSSLQDVRNPADEENDYIPECDSEIFFSPDLKYEIDPIYNLVIAKEVHSPLKIFDHLNKRIGKPILYSEDSIKFPRNSSLIKVSKVD